MDIHELFEAAGNLHGHLCPGLAIGVRAAAEAGGLLHGELRCAAGNGIWGMPEQKISAAGAVRMYSMSADLSASFGSGRRYSRSSPPAP